MKLLLTATILLLLVTNHTSADWPAFLGGQQRAQVNLNLPAEWSPQAGVTWSAKLPGHGQSSPVQIGNLVYVTAIEGPQKETNLVLAYDLENGQRQWEHRSTSSLPVKNDDYTSRAAPTPVADQGGVYAFFESGNLVALNPRGEVRWERSLIDDYGKFEGPFGLGGSLAQVDDRIFVLADNEGPAYLLAIDKATGETIWKTDRDSRTAWSSPMIVNVGQQPQIVVSASGSIDGYHPDSGERLWTFDDVGGNTVASPIPFADGRFLVGAAPGRNGENTQGAKRSNMAIEIRSAGDTYQPVVLWRNEQATSSFGTPIVHQGFAYYTNRAGVLYCLDVTTGKTVYNARLAESNWATPIGLGDRIYFFGRGGTTTVMAGGGSEQKVAENRLYPAAVDGGGRGGFGGEIQYGIAATPAGLIVRTGTNLYLIGGTEQN